MESLVSLGKLGTTVALLALLSVPANAGYRVDCDSPGSWFGHVRVAFSRLLGASFSAALPDLTKMAITGQLNTEEGVSGAITIAAQSVAAHINPFALVDMAAALVCVPNDGDGINP